MALFARRKRDEDVPGESEAPAEEAEETRGFGPWDEAEKPELGEHLDFGVLRVPRAIGVRVQFTINKRSKEAMGVLVESGDSAMQINVYAAPKSADLWADLRDELAESIADQGGSTKLREGPWGPELEALIPRKDVNETRHVRYVGVDGPRWFLRATLEGRAVTSKEVRENFYTYIKSCVVARGSAPHPARGLIHLTMPESAKTRLTEQLSTRSGALPRRGPEMTETR